MNDTKVLGGFWRSKADVVAREMLPYQWKALNDQIPGAEPSHALNNFRIAAGEAQGKHGGTIFQDSDVAKWLEAASYALGDHDDPELEKNVDEAIRLIGKAQGADGYVNTWFTLVGPDKRWSDLAWGHELYCGGHLIEAAVAHFQSTGSRKFLDIMMRYADCLFPVFGPGGTHDGQACGHPEIELALHRLAEATGELKYAELADRFVDNRGNDPREFTGKKPLGFEIPDNAWFQADYFQGHAPLRHQHHADGHAVRAMYLYTAMARQAKETNDEALKTTLKELWSSVVDKRMYVTGSIGSHAMGERFSIDYDLPSDTAYNETCASIGVLFWSRAMLELDPHSRYADVWERVAYNGALSGMALDGKSFFYVNPLAVVPSTAKYRYDHEHVKTSRVAWFGVSCCPPNIARMVSSVGRYAVSVTRQTVRVDQFIDGETPLPLPGNPVLRLKTNYPWEGSVALEIKTEAAAPFSLAVRIPGWCTSYAVRLNGKTLEQTKGADGYVTLFREWADGDTIELEMAMPVRFVSAHPAVSELAGSVAVCRGPLVFCAEEADNGSELHNLSVDPRAPAKVLFSSDHGGSLRVTLEGRRRASKNGGGLYEPWSPREQGDQVEVTLVPYHQWGNRKPGQEMRVWLRSAPN